MRLDPQVLRVHKEWRVRLAQWARPEQPVRRVCKEIRARMEPRELKVCKA